MDKGKSAKELGLRNVIRLGYVSLFTDISTEMILGVLPVNFIIDQLGATAAILGLIEGSAEAANNIFRIFAGVLTDKIAKRKPIVVIGYGLVHSCQTALRGGKLVGSSVCCASC